MDDLKDSSGNGISDACEHGRPARVNKDVFAGTGPYRRVRTKPSLDISGIRATLRLPGLLAGVADGAQPIASLAAFDKSRPNIYLSALTTTGRAMDIGIQTGFENSENIQKAFVNPEPDWTWHVRKPITGPTVVVMEFTFTNGTSEFKLWKDSVSDENLMAHGSSSKGVWQGTWNRFAFVTSIAVPLNETDIFDRDVWVGGVEWFSREVRDRGVWRELRQQDVGSFGAYPQRNDKLNSSGSKKWAHETPIFVDGVKGAGWHVAREHVTIDFRRARNLT